MIVTFCNGLNVCVPRNSYVGILTPKEGNGGLLGPLGGARL